MKKEIFIHVGAGKTGTSALQRFFLDNEDYFLDAGFVFPAVGRTGRNDAIAHHKLCDWGPHNDGNSIQRWRELDEHHRAINGSLIVSSEVFHSKISEPDGIAYFNQVREVLEGWEIVIIMYIRRQSQWLQSAYSQWVKSNIHSRPIVDLAERYKKNLAKQAIAFGEVFGKENVVVRPYEKCQFEGGNIFQDFANIVSLEWTDRLRIPEANENPRLTVDALELKRRMNAFASTPAELRLCEKLLLEYSSSVSKGETKAKFAKHSILTAELIKQIEEASAPFYKVIAEEYMGRADGRLFYEPLGITQDLPKPRGLEQLESVPDSIIFLLAEVFKRLEKDRRDAS